MFDITSFISPCELLRFLPGGVFDTALLAFSELGDREECLAARTDDYVTKPIRVEALVEALMRLPQRGHTL